MRRTAHRGFTLIELLVVIAIILILAAILFPVFAKVRAKALQTTCQSNLKQIGIASEMYQTAWGDVLVPFGAPFHSSYHDRIWYGLIDPYLKQIEGGKFNNTNLGKLYRCPAATEEEETGFAYQRSYGMSPYCGGTFSAPDKDGNYTDFKTVPVSEAKYASSTIRVAETEWKGSQGGSALAPYVWDRGNKRIIDWNVAGAHVFAVRHNDNGNVLWIDGHVGSMNTEKYRMTLAVPGDTNPDHNVWLRLGGPKASP